jgi:hypothetical protein
LQILPQKDDKNNFSVPLADKSAKNLKSCFPTPATLPINRQNRQQLFRFFRFGCPRSNQNGTAR